jgi:signal transduction histidine kinase
MSNDRSIETDKPEPDRRDKLESLREPLSVIKNAAYFLDMRFESKDDEETKHFELIDKELKRALSMIDNLLLK